MTRLKATVVVFLLLPIASSQAQDFERYIELFTAAEEAHNMLDGADPALVDALLENAVQRDLAVIVWLDDFIGSDAFGELPSDQQALAYQDRYRHEYNASLLLIQLDRCEEALERVGTLLESPIDDADLRPRLAHTYEVAQLCITTDTASCTIGASVEVLWSGSWYPATILAGPNESGQCQIHYDGYDASWDEWVGSNRMSTSSPSQPTTPGRGEALCIPGNPVEVLWSGTWYDATVLAGTEASCMIHYDGYDSSWDEAVGPDRMRSR